MTRAVRSTSRRRRPVHPGHESCDDRGLSLIEVLVAVVLLGLGGVAVLGSIGTSIKGSSTHEQKIEALATLESAAAALQHKAEPCTAEAYRSRAAGAVSDSQWAASLAVVNLQCGSETHDLELSVTSHGGLVQTLAVSVGGPRVADVPGGGEFDDANVPFVSCAVTSISAVPSSIELNDIGLLTSDVRVEARTDAVCSGSLRAVFSPEPVDPATNLEWRPSFQEIGERHYELILTEGTFAWHVGPVNARIEHRQPDETFINLGAVNGLLTTTCQKTTHVSNPTPTRHADGGLLDDLFITVELSTACPTPASMSFSVNTGLSTFTADLVPTGSTWTGIIPGHDHGGPEFTPGPKTITFVAPIPVGSLHIEVQ